MSDSFIYDAINAFKFSPTGRGQISNRLGGDAQYVSRYQPLPAEVLATLWRLWSQDKIAFVERLPDNARAMSYPGRREGNVIEVATGGFGIGSGRIGEVSSRLVHEAVHLARPRLPLIEQEMHCETLQYLYHEDLVSGIRITSRYTGRQEVVGLSTIDSAEAGDRRIYEWFRRGQLIDRVVAAAFYRSTLTAAWIRRSIDWWGGIANRWLATRGHYVRVLAAEQGNRQNGSLILDILISVPRGDVRGWNEVMSTATSEGSNIEAIRRAVSPFVVGGTVDNRVREIEDRWGQILSTPFESPGRLRR